MPSRPIAAIAAIAALALAGAWSADASAPDFAVAIKPILDARCVECHGEKKAKGGLRLDTPAGIRAGGKGGAAVVAGKPEESPLLTRTLLPADHEDVMPPKGDPLAKEQTDLIRQWIAGGAALP